MCADWNNLNAEQGIMDLNGIKIMLIDDSRTIRRSAETMLSKECCEVITANDGFAALALIHKQHPDLIFVDIMMPRLDGYQTRANMKNNPRFKNVPVDLISNTDGQLDNSRARIARA